MFPPILSAVKTADPERLNPGFKNLRNGCHINLTPYPEPRKLTPLYHRIYIHVYPKPLLHRGFDDLAACKPCPRAAIVKRGDSCPQRSCPQGTLQGPKSVPTSCCGLFEIQYTKLYQEDVSIILVIIGGLHSRFRGASNGTDPFIWNLRTNLCRLQSCEHEPLCKLLVSPLTTPTVVQYILPYMTPH